MAAAAPNSTEYHKVFQSSHRSSAVVLFLVIVSGVLGNIFVTVTIFRQKRLLKMNYYYLVLQLAVCDCIVLLCYFDEVCQLWEPTFSIIRSTMSCKFWSSFQFLVFTASPYFMVLIGIFRFRVVVYPLKPPTSRCKLNIIISMVYVVATFYTMPFVWVLKYDPSLGCIEDWPTNMFVASVLFPLAFNYFVPVLFLVILYSIICRTLVKQNNVIAYLSVSTLQDKNVRKTISKHRRNVKTFIVSVTVVICYAVSALPVQLWWIFVGIGKVTQNPFQSNWVWMFFIYLTGTSALNPLIYGIIDNHFLTIFKKWKGQIFNSRRIMNSENST